MDFIINVFKGLLGVISWGVIFGIFCFVAASTFRALDSWEGLILMLRKWKK